jgi:hypothetical protein
MCSNVVLPALSNPKNNILAFLLTSPAAKVKTQVRVAAPTQTRQNVKEPVDDEHDKERKQRMLTKRTELLLFHPSSTK